MTTIVEVIVNPSNLYIDVITQQSLTVEEINSFISLPAGGSTGQVLSKASNTTGDIVWSNASGSTATNLTIANKTSTTFDIVSSTGTDVTLPAATTTEAGLLVAADKTKLNNLATVATSGNYSDLSGVPSTFAPSVHTHIISDVTGLQTTLDGKFNNPIGDTTQYIAGDGSLVAFPVAGQAGTLVRQVRNEIGSTLTKGTVVYISGASGNKALVTKAVATSDATSAQTFGIVQADIPTSQNGYVVVRGDIAGIDTNAYPDGTQLYLSGSVAGTFTATKPVAPIHIVYVGIVTRQHVNQGQIEVAIQNGYEMEELHDVLVVSKTDKDVISYDSVSNLWKNKQLNSTYITDFITAADARVAAGITGKENTITAGTTAQYWRGDKSWQTLNSTAVGLGNVNNTSDANKPVSTATQTALNLKYDASNPSGYTTNTGTVTTASIVTANGFSGSVANASTTPAITISLQNATTGQSGQLTSTDWNTFNSKQEVLVSGTNIKTVNGTSLLGSGNVAISGITSGTSTVSFGSTATNEAQLIVTGQSGIDAGTKVIASIGTTATSDYTVNDHKYLGAMGVSVTVGDVVASTGFTIYVRSYQKMTGDISINWVY